MLSKAPSSSRSAFTLIELLVVIAIIAILAVVVVLTLNPAELLRQSRDANRVSDMATLTSALNLYTTDQSGVSTFSLGTASNTAISVYDPTASTTCGGLGLPAWNTNSGQAWQCATSSTYHNVANTGWIPVNFNAISSGAPMSNLPVDPVNQTSSGLFYSYNTNGSQFTVTANLESSKYKAQYGTHPQTTLFPEVISGGTPSISALYNPSGLVGYWPLNEGSGTVAIDQSGNGNNLNIVNLQWFSGSGCKTSFCLGNAAGSAWTAVSPSFETIGTQNAFTIAGWMNIGTFASQRFFSDGSWCNPGTWLFYNTVFGVTNSSGCSGQIMTGISMPTNTWTYFVGTFDGATVKAYINGVWYSQTAAPGVTLTTTTEQFLLNEDSHNNDSFGDLRLYNRALSAAEVQALYNAEQ